MLNQRKRTLEEQLKSYEITKENIYIFEVEPRKRGCKILGLEKIGI